jgi:hypothetical protein
MLPKRALVSVLLLFLLVPPAPVHAAWETLRIDADTNIPSIELDGELAAYEKQGDLFLYRISSGQLTRVTQDLHDMEDRIIALQAETLWYWGQDSETSLHHLHRYSAQTGQDEWLFSSDALIDENQGTADAGRAVILKDHDWFLVDEDRITQVTFSGEGLDKEDAWLSGDYLVWTAVAGTPGVYVTHLPTKETNCIIWDNDPPTSLWVSGMYASWVAGPAQGQYWILACRIDTGEFGFVGSSEEKVPWQLAMDYPHLVWLKKIGPLWLVMDTNIQEETEECLYLTELSIDTPRISGDDILLITENCPDEGELCSELNVFNRVTGILTQLTYFGHDSFVSLPRIEAGRIAFMRRSTAFPLLDEAYVGFKTSESGGWALPNASPTDTALNLALLLPPLAIAPWHGRRRIRRRRGLRP